MRRLLITLLPIFCAAAQQPSRDVTVTYRANRISLEQVVIAIAKQAGLRYDWKKSLEQAGPECRQTVRDVNIQALPFAAAMHQALDPAGLDYEVENGEVVLYRVQTGLPPDATLGIVAVNRPGMPPSAALAEKLARKITYSSSGKSVQYVVIDLAQLVGLRYNFNQSFALTDPECRQTVFDFSIRNESFSKAMARVLKPVKLGYRIEGEAIVLYRP